MKLVARVKRAIRRTISHLGQWLISSFMKHLAHAAILAALLLLPSYRFYDLEGNIYDSEMKAKHLLGNWSLPAVRPDLAVIGIDDQARRADTTGRLSRLPPLSRRYLAELIDAITPLQPRVIVLDIFLDFPSEPLTDDAALERSILGAQRKGISFVLACRLANTGGRRIPVLPLPRYLTGESALVGHAEVVASSVDGVIRRAVVATPILEEKDLARILQRGMEDQMRFFDLDEVKDNKGIYYFWSLAGATLAALQEESQLKQLRRMLNSAPFLIDFSAHPDHAYASYSSAQVMSARFDGTPLKGRIVLIGVNYTESPDRHPTPLSVRSLSVGQLWSLGPVYGEPFSGTEIQAYIIHSLLSRTSANQGIREVSTFPLLLAGFILGILVLASFNHLERGWWAALVIGVPLTYSFVATLLFQVGNLYLPILRPIAGYLLVAGLGHRVLNEWPHLWTEGAPN